MRKLTTFFVFLFLLVTYLSNDIVAQEATEKGKPTVGLKSSTTYKTITGSPLTIYVGDGGDYQVHHSVFGSNQVYSASAIPASGGLFAWYNGTSIGFSGAAMGSFRNWVPVSQADVVGSGSASDPFRVVTTFNDPTGISMTATTSYVNGLDYFNVTWTINLPGVGNVTTFIAQDLMLGGSDSGYCWYDPSTGAVAGTNNADPNLATQFQMYVPVTPLPNAYSVQSYSTIWGLIGQNGIPGAGLGNEVATGFVDNGMALQYNLSGASSYTVDCIWAFTADAGSVTGGITTSTNLLEYFVTPFGTPSAAKTFTTSATNLTANLIVTAPDKYEVSLDGTTYTPTVTIPHSGGSVTNQIVYVRINGTAVEGFAYQDLTLSSTDVTSKTVSLRGVVTSLSGCGLNAGSDLTYEFGSFAQLGASGADTYEWHPTTGLSNPNIANPTVSGGADGSVTTYTVVGISQYGANIAVNGDFEAGNTGFTSDYGYVAQAPTALNLEGLYGIGTNPHSYHPDFSACTDHTTGSGNMMIINGAPVANEVIWSQNITVQPNTDYAFYAHLTSVHPSNPATLQFSINGTNLGSPFTASAGTCGWTKFQETWNSGSNTSITISVVNQNTINAGNDFAIDDIVFAEFSTTYCADDVIVTVGNGYTVTFDVSDDGTPVEGATIVVDGQTITTTGGIATIDLQNGVYTYIVNIPGEEPIVGVVIVNGLDVTVYVTTPVVTQLVTFTATNGTNLLPNTEIVINGQTIVTNASGIATIELPAGNYPYIASSQGLADVSGTITVGSSPVNITVTFIPAGTLYTLTFTVVDGSAVPVVGATISVNAQTLTTIAGGIATLQVPNGNYSYTVNAAGFNSATGTAVVASANKNESVILTPTSATQTVTFTVVDLNNVIMPNVTIVVNGQTLTTDNNGVATVGLPNGLFGYTTELIGYYVSNGSVEVAGTPENVTIVIVMMPPSGLTYLPNPISTTVGTAITPSVPTYEGIEVVFTCPNLPAGLTIDPVTGIISGTPTVVVPPTVFTVTATNEGGSTTATVTITVYAVAPTVQATNVIISNPHSTQFDVDWTRGNGQYCAVFVKQANTGEATPVENTTYTANSAFMSGTQIGASGWYCVYNGTDNEITVTAFSPETEYRVMVVEYNGFLLGEKYLSTPSTNNPANGKTLALEPTVQAHDIIVNHKFVNKLDIEWTNGNGESRAVFVFEGNTGEPVALDGVTYIDDVTFSLGSQIGNTGWFCIYNGTENNVVIENLTVETEYRIMVLEYNGENGSENYNLNIATLNPITTNTLTYSPSEQAHDIVATSRTDNSLTFNWINGNGELRAVFVLEGNSGKPILEGGIAYLANAEFGAGDTDESGNWSCVYNGTASTVTVTGLEIETEYRIMVCEYNYYMEGYQNYLTITAVLNPINTYTLPLRPDMQASNLEFSNIRYENFDADWTRGDGEKNVVFVKQTNTGSAEAEDFVTYVDNTKFMTGDQLGSTGWYCVYNGTERNVTVTGLTPNTEYRLMVIEYNGLVDNQLYLNETNTTNPGNVKTLKIPTADDIPNFFSPNGDGVNDTWKIDNLDLVQDYKLYIWNNIHALIYESDNYDNTWDASFNGNKLESDTYYYMFIKDEIKITGTITVIK